MGLCKGEEDRGDKMKLTYEDEHIKITAESGMVDTCEILNLCKRVLVCAGHHADNVGLYDDQD